MSDDILMFEVAYHSSVVIDENLYIWAGIRPDAPYGIHDSPEKLEWSSSIKKFSFLSGLWSTECTTGQPPLGIISYSCVALGDKIYYFGGHCGHFNCYHNSLTALDVSSMKWDRISETSDQLAVMKRRSGGLATIETDGFVQIFSLGGFGSWPAIPHKESSYVQDRYGYVRTNEMNLFNLSTREWITPSAIVGQSMPPTSHFTIENFGESQAIIFGGIINEGDNTDSLYIIKITDNTVYWENISKPSPKIWHSIVKDWPTERWGHASAMINRTTLVIMGGRTLFGSERPDNYGFWFFDITKHSWERHGLCWDHDHRYDHSMSSVMLSEDRVWLMFIGGFKRNRKQIQFHLTNLAEFKFDAIVHNWEHEKTFSDRYVAKYYNNLEGFDKYWATIGKKDEGENDPIDDDDSTKVLKKVQYNIENVNEVQVFERVDYGIKLIIPPSSIPSHQSINTTIQPVPTDTFTLPPNVEPVSSFYEFGTLGSFTESVKLHIQHNVQLESAEDTSRLSFVIGNGPPPYTFELCDADAVKQNFVPGVNSGEIYVPHYSTNIFGIVWKSGSDKKRAPKVYAINPFFKQIDENIWYIMIVVTENLATFLKKLKCDDHLKDYIEKTSSTFTFSSEAIALCEDNEVYDIVPLKSTEVDKSEVDQYQETSSAFPHIHVKAKLKSGQSLSDLRLEFEGTVKKFFFTIPKSELTRKPSTVSDIPLSPSDKLLDMKPKMHHLLQTLNEIKYQWKAIGVQLEIRYGDLQSLDQDEGLNDTGRLLEVIQFWFDGKTKAATEGTWKVSWRKVLEVVKKPPIENVRVHDEVIDFLLQPGMKEIYLSPIAAGFYDITKLCSMPMITDEVNESNSDLQEAASTPQTEVICVEIDQAPTSPDVLVNESRIPDLQETTDTPQTEAIDIEIVQTTTPPDVLACEVKNPRPSLDIHVETDHGTDTSTCTTNFFYNCVKQLCCCCCNRCNNDGCKGCLGTNHND